jgi:hypothetical protein
MQASAIIAFLCFVGALPLLQKGRTHTEWDHYDRQIQFSGYDWLVKSSLSRTGPGPNFFSDAQDNVWIDDQGRLHLAINTDGNRWYCAEVVSKKSFGYGRYEFVLGTSPVLTDNNVVFGLFTWDRDLKPHHNEIDIEFSSWGVDRTRNSQYVIHKDTDINKSHRFAMSGSDSETLHVMTWSPGETVFESYIGSTPLPRRRIDSWRVTGEYVHTPANEQVRMNLWLFGGIPPDDEAEGIMGVTVNSFTFTPLKY